MLYRSTSHRSVWIAYRYFQLTSNAWNYTCKDLLPCVFIPSPFFSTSILTSVELHNLKKCMLPLCNLSSVLVKACLRVFLLSLSENFHGGVFGLWRQRKAHRPTEINLGDNWIHCKDYLEHSIFCFRLYRVIAFPRCHRSNLASKWLICGLTKPNLCS